MNSTVKTIMFWVFILICLMMLWAVVSRGTGVGKEPEYSYSELLDKVQAGQVQDVTIQGTELHGHLKATPKEQFHTTIPASTDSTLPVAGNFGRTGTLQDNRYVRLRRLSVPESTGARSRGTARRPVVRRLLE